MFKKNKIKAFTILEIMVALLMLSIFAAAGVITAYTFREKDNEVVVSEVSDAKVETVINCGSGINIGGKCFSTPFIPVPLNKEICEEYQDELGIQECFYEDDYWAGAVRHCGGIDKMPSAKDLAQLAQVIYDKNQRIDIKEETTKLVYSDGNSINYLMKELPVNLWSQEENSKSSTFIRGYNKTETNWRYIGRNTPDVFAICIME